MLRLLSSHSSLPVIIPSPHIGLHSEGVPLHIHPSSILQDTEQPSPSKKLKSSQELEEIMIPSPQIS